MDFREQTIFFFTTFHGGLFNIFMHALSVYPYYLGFVSFNLWFIALGIATEEIGHLYNHFFKFDKDLRRKSFEILPYQISAILIFVFVIGWFSGWFG